MRCLADSIFLYGTTALWVGRNLELDRVLTRGQDLSYGVYIYAYPREQLATRAFPAVSTLAYLEYYGVALAATFALAALSWRLVEKPALRAKGPVSDGLERWARRFAPRLARPSATAAASPEEDLVAP